MTKISKIIDVKPFMVICEFSDGYVKKIDLTDWIIEFSSFNNNWTSKLANPEFFNSVKLTEYGTLLWGSNIDFDSEVLYQKGTILQTTT